MKTLTRLVVSAACSVLVLGLLLSLAGSLGADVSPSDVVAALRSAIPTLVAAYALCQLVQAFARAQRVDADELDYLLQLAFLLEQPHRFVALGDEAGADVFVIPALEPVEIQ